MNERDADHLLDLAQEWVAAARHWARNTSSRSMDKDQDDARDAFVNALNDAVKQDNRAASPYPNFCVQPDKCAGKGYCPRDPTCVD